MEASGIVGVTCSDDADKHEQETGSYDVERQLPHDDLSIIFEGDSVSSATKPISEYSHNFIAFGFGSTAIDLSRCCLICMHDVLEECVSLSLAISPKQVQQAKPNKWLKQRRSFVSANNARGLPRPSVYLSVLSFVLLFKPYA